MTDYRKQYREAQRARSSRIFIPLAALGLFLLLFLLLLLFRPPRGEPLSSVAEPIFEAEKLLSRSLVQRDPAAIPPYTGQLWVELEGGSVLYRVTPLFIGEELVARGVEMEACSLRDRGEALCFHVFVYKCRRA